ncbi:hypothetical protein GYA93_11170 [Gordonia desulfuricans]|uniref:RNA polymerase sigma-70 region 2 domain-containing protein n=1 Tax=Gordonia desulfuricans TaxID=89051 RepID=A0A7K3LPH8_9ACTN|nr:hypothetical protein [Gordonia desulfuricans]
MSGGTTHDQRTDEQLLHAHIHGDPTAFTILITRHQSYLWTVANRTTGNPDDAADALQEALLSAHLTRCTEHEPHTPAIQPSIPGVSPSLAQFACKPTGEGRSRRYSCPA